MGIKGKSIDQAVSAALIFLDETQRGLQECPHEDCTTCEWGVKAINVIAGLLEELGYEIVLMKEN